MKIHKTPFAVLPAALALWGLAACSPDQGAQTANTPKPIVEVGGVDAVSTDRIINANEAPHNWLSYGGGYDEQRHARLDKINRDNIGDLGPAWVYEMRRDRGVEATPIVVDGVIYVSGSWSIVYALDGKTGEELWVHDPQVPGATAVVGCCGVVNRGVAVYEGKVFVGTFDGRLQALDAQTGELLWSTVTVDQTRPYTITGAPRTAKGKVFIGNGGGEFGVRGYISAYDVETGELAWRFYTTPDPEKKPEGAASDEALAALANDTWGDTGAWTVSGGGGTVWDAIVYDHVNDSLIFGVGNGAPWNDKIRDPESDGDNLFLSSIVAVDVNTGAYKWHFQSTPREKWDYTATQPIILADLPLGENGASRRVAMQAPKNGFFYVLDAATGEFIHADNFVPVNWADGLDEDGRPRITAAARDTATGVQLTPGSHGGHNWHPMAFNPETGLVYFPTHTTSLNYKDPAPNTDSPIASRVGYDPLALVVADYPPGTIEAARSHARGFLTAWDPVKNAAAWQLPLEAHDNGGVMSTAGGLIFQGDTHGGFRAHDAATGEVLWRTDLKVGLMAAPSTYEVDGEQYIVAALGPGGAIGGTFGYSFDPPLKRSPGRVVAFKLNGDAEIPDIFAPEVDETPKTEAFGDEALVARGMDRFTNLCGACHGIFAISSGLYPDLRWSYVSADTEVWNSVVMEGALVDNGMIGFSDFLSADDSEAIRAYVIDQAHLALRNRDALANEPAAPH